LVPKLKGPLWKVVKFADGLYKSELNLIAVPDKFLKEELSES